MNGQAARRTKRMSATRQAESVSCQIYTLFPNQKFHQGLQDFKALCEGDAWGWTNSRNACVNWKQALVMLYLQFELECLHLAIWVTG